MADASEEIREEAERRGEVAGGLQPAAQDGTPAETPAGRDWAEEAYECFVKDARDIDPTDPVKAIEAYFRKNATDELKARCKAEGKDAEGCWRFIEAVARRALHGSSGHIDPAVVYAVAMHWFEDVPKDWDKAERGTKAERSPAVRTEKPAKKETKIEKLERKVAQGQSEPVRQKAKEELRKAKAAKRKPRAQQGFFFDVLMQPDAQKPCGASSPQGSPVAPAEETAVEPGSEAGSISESEVQ